MPGVRIFWQADTDSDTVNYDVWRQLPTEGTPTFLVRVTAVKSAANWKPDLTQGPRYYFDDSTGSRDSIYQVFFLTADDTVTGQTPLFRPMDATGAQIITRIPIDHNYGSQDALLVTAPGGAPISFLTIYVFKKIDYDGGNKTLPVGITETLPDGRWKNPVYVEPGLDYVLVFEKSQAFGPTTLVLSVPPVAT